MIWNFKVFFGSRIFIAKLFIFLAFTTSSCVNALERKLSTELNPGCGKECENVTLLYVRADSPNDSLHYIWDFTAKPNFLLARTSVQSRLQIDWTKFFWKLNDKSLKFTETPAYTFGFVLNKIWEFNDVNDTGVITNIEDSNIISIDMNEFKWTLVNFSISNTSSFLKMKSSNGPRNGTVEISVRSYGSKAHGEELPHLFHSSNSSQLDISFDRLETNPNFNYSRFAIELILFSQENKINETFRIISRKSLDDEHTPGVFTMNDLVSPNASQEGDGGGWFLWRKVSYTSEIRDIANSTEVNEYTVKDVGDHSSSLRNTAIYAFHGYSVDDFLVQATNISFGFKQDGFYKKSNYTTWTFLVGYGYPLAEEFSLLVILVISIGLGLPALLIIIGGLYLGFRRLASNKDELSLSR